MDERQRRRMRLLLLRFVEAMTAWAFSKRTIPTYTQHVAVFLDWLDQETDVGDLAEVTPEVLSGYQTALLGMERKRPGKRKATEPKSATAATAAAPEAPAAAGGRLSTATQHARLSALKSFFGFLAREGKLLVDPAASLVLPKKRRSLPRSLLTPKEALKLVESIETKTPMGHRDRAVVEVLYATGIRNAELRGLSLADFDAEAGTLFVRAGKGGKDRVLPLGPVVTAIVSDYVQLARPKLAKRPGVTSLFVSNHGWPLWPASVVRIVDLAARRAGLQKTVRPHRLRHACATHMLQGGADVRHIQRLLGHSSLSTTEVYTRVEIGDLKAVHKRFHPRERGRA
jgi:integrase/recombinase XerD